MRIDARDEEMSLHVDPYLNSIGDSALVGFDTPEQRLRRQIDRSIHEEELHRMREGTIYPLDKSDEKV